MKKGAVLFVFGFVFIGLLFISLISATGFYHPADVNQDGTINGTEANNYNFNFKQGLDFNGLGIPSIAYATRANYLFAKGGNYSYNYSLQCPQCWNSGDWSQSVIPNPGQTIWAKAFGTGNGIGASTATDSDGHIFIAGYFSGTVDFGSGPITSSGSNDIVFGKYSSDGVLIWVKTFGGTGDDGATSIAVDKNNDVVVTGYFSGTATIGANVLSSRGGYDIFLLKLNASDGTSLWSKQFGYTGNDYGLAVAVDPSNANIVLTGQYIRAIDFGNGLGQHPSTGGGIDSFLAEFYPDGTNIWGKNFYDQGNDNGQTVAVDSNGNIFLAGETSAAINLGGGFLPFYGQLRSNLYIGKFDSSGGYLWGNCIGNGNGASAQGVIVDNNNDPFLTGSFGYGTTDFGGISLTHEGGFSDPFIVRLNGSNGSALWGTALLPSGGGQGTSIKVDSLNNILISGTFTGSSFPIGSTTLTGAGGWDAFVAKFNSSGNPMWAKGFGGTSSDMSGGIVVDRNGNAVVTGYTFGGNFGGINLTTGGSYNIFLMKLFG